MKKMSWVLGGGQILLGAGILVLTLHFFKMSDDSRRVEDNIIEVLDSSAVAVQGMDKLYQHSSKAYCQAMVNVNNFTPKLESLGDFVRKIGGKRLGRPIIEFSHNMRDFSAAGVRYYQENHRNNVDTIRHVTETLDNTSGFISSNRPYSRLCRLISLMCFGISGLFFFNGIVLFIFPLFADRKKEDAAA